MRVGILLTFRPKKTDTLGSLLRTVAERAPSASAGFIMGESPVPGGVETIARVLKRFPELSPFERALPIGPGMPGERRTLTNLDAKAAITGPPVAFETLLAIADGVPRSFPFHGVTFAFQSPVFGEPAEIPGLMRRLSPGVIVQDSWWVSGRQRSVVITAIVDGDPQAKGLPPLPAELAAVAAAFGKPASTQNFPIPEPGGGLPAAPVVPVPGIARRPVDPRVAAIVDEFRAKHADFVAGLALPHALPSREEALRGRNFGERKAGPMKPVLVKAFKPLGYDCKAESGTYTLRRRTSSNHVVEVYMDVGSWSRSYVGFYKIHAPDGQVSLSLPPSPAATGQYPIAGPEGWQRIVDNLAVIVAALDRELAEPVCAAWGPAPEWFDPAA